MKDARKKSKATKTRTTTTTKTITKPRRGRRAGRSTGFINKTVQVQRGVYTMPNEYYAKLKFVESFPISADGASGVASILYSYRTNGAFDPRLELGGGQPLFYDTFAPYYKRVCVYGAYLKITFSNPLYDGMYVGVRIRNDNDTYITSGTTLNNMQTLPNTRIKPLNNTGSQVVVFKGWIDNPKLFGITKSNYMSELQFQHGISSNPADEGIIEPFAIHSVGEVSTVRCNVEIIYHCRFSMMQTVPDA